MQLTCNIYFRLFQQHLQYLYNGPLMIFGADVNHPSPVDKGTTESIAAVCVLFIIWI